MKDRLKDLIKDTLQEWDCDVSDKTILQIADHLIDNGVIVPPCKVGDTVYQTDGVIIYELEIFDIGLRKNKPYYETESIDFDEDAIGKTVFLTREEAEKALERSENGKS